VGLAKGTTLAAIAGADNSGDRLGHRSRFVTTPTTQTKGVVSSVLIPEWAILDAELTLSLPTFVIAATGIDAMVHAIEAYASRHKKNPISDQFARQALGLLSANVRRVCEDGHDIEARSQMLGSMLAGTAFATRLWRPSTR